MELRHLRYFIAVAEELHFGHAAARLHIAQPPLSQQIQSLEAELGLKLFWRSSRKVELTAAGEAFLQGARKTLAEADDAVRIARSIHGGETAVVTLGFVDSSVYSFMPAVLREFRRQHPSVRVVIRALTSAQQVLALERGEIQVGILRPLRTSSRITCEELGRENLLVALPIGHRLADHDRIRIPDLKDEPFVFFRREFVPSVYDRIVGMFHRAGLVPNIVQEAGEQHTLIGLVAAGIGFSITAEGLRDWGTRDVAYRSLVHPAAWVSMSIAWRKSERSEPVSWFVSSARATASARQAALNPC